MQNNAINNVILADLEYFGLPELPNEVIDSHRMPMDISGDLWRFNDAVAQSSFNFKDCGVKNPWFLYSLKRHLIYCIQRVSPRESWNTIRLNVLFMSKCASWNDLCIATTVEASSDSVNRVMSEVVERLRRENVLYNFARIRAWYRWCVDYIPDFGFDSDEAYKWEQIRVPGNEKGVAVRTENQNDGPLNDAELIQLRRALQSDKSMAIDHIQQRSALWLSLVYGRNPANFALLRVGDFKNLTDGDIEDVYTLDIPRIKKRKVPRTEFKTEYVDPTLAKIIKELIVFGGRVDVETTVDRPLFVRKTCRENLLGTPMNEWAWHITTNDFTYLIRAAVARYGIISPRTNCLLYITTRRLRYTFATNRVREGVSAIDLAEMLDHTDLQNVRVYFDTKSTIVERLDRAAAKEIAPILNLFKGSIVKNGSYAENGNDAAKRIRIVPELMKPTQQLDDLGSCGKKEFCNLYPPYSCYPCDRFQPFSDSLDVHELVFDFLLERRERMRIEPLQSNRIAVQLDEVIYACAEVIQNMKLKNI